MSTPPVRVLIVDDEALSRGLIREYLAVHTGMCVVGESAHGLQAVQDITALNPDLIFLDIQMPKLTGLEVLELTGRRSGVIFTTADDQHALKAFDLHAVDYLLKPFSQSRFAVHRACQALAMAQAVAELPAPDALSHLLAAASQRPARILIRDRNQVHVIAVNTIETVQAQDDYVSIQTAGRTYLKTQPLAELAAQLDPAQFVRVHRSYVLNVNYLQSLERATKDSFVAVLHSGQKIPISRAGYERLDGLLNGPSPVVSVRT